MLHKCSTDSTRKGLQSANDLQGHSRSLTSCGKTRESVNDDIMTQQQSWNDAVSILCNDVFIPFGRRQKLLYCFDEKRIVQGRYISNFSYSFHLWAVLLFRHTWKSLNTTYSSYDDRVKRLGLMRLNTRRLRSDLVETFKIINGKYSIHPEIFFSNLMMATEEDIAKSCLKEGVDWI